jgi:vacuolar-type H+-ATPase catalytic subunit A/Vma1
MGLTSRNDTILDEIEGALAAAEGETASLARIEDALTSGYAWALALEAERLRLEERVASVVAELAGGDAGGADELAQLTRSMSRADGDLDHLRGLLAALRARASTLRAARPAASA